MKVKMLSIASGPEWSADVGSVVDRPDAEAKALIKGGFAEAFVETTEAAVEAETPEAPAAPVETAVKTTPNVQVATKKG